ncbi:MAG: transglycosylase SLT domain-containing protein [Bacteroidetes bacterium]|nr:transglycosylase SLT domain-containing protein [Bacteroidota bacterium]
MKKLRILAIGLISSALSFSAIAQAPVRLSNSPQAESNLLRLDSLMNVFHDKYYSFKDDIEKVNVYGFDSNYVPSYSDEVIKYRLSLLESPIPLEYNQYVKGFIDLYAVRKKKLTQHILTWSDYYFPQFEQILDEQGMPLEFKYLAVIESALNPNAQSWCGATGLWQFMYGTGLMYGLKINNYVDERKDPIKATYAACQYFKDMYALYHDWLLVIAAYNCGPGNVNRAIRMSGGHYNFWKIMPYLPTETRGYVPAFIAATYVLNYHQEHNIYKFEETPVNYVTDTVHVDSKLTFAQIAQSLNINEDQLRMLNPSYKLGILPNPNESGKSHVLRLPYHKAISFTDLKENLYASNHPYMRPAATPTLVQNSGDSLNQENETLTSINKDLDNKKPKVAKSKIAYYKVKRGDGLYIIANRYGCTITDIKKWNKLHSNAIKPGQLLAIHRG